MHMAAVAMAERGTQVHNGMAMSFPGRHLYHHFRFAHGRNLVTVTARNEIECQKVNGYYDADKFHGAKIRKKRCNRIANLGQLP
jgi:hypothetical protein